MNATLSQVMARADELLATSPMERVGAHDHPARPKRWFVCGDPQTTMERFAAVLAAHDLIGDDGWLRPDVGLVSIGDHFDFRVPDELTALGPERARLAMGEAGERILSWLLAHPCQQVVVLAGNHDLCRVMELADFDDARFAQARRLAIAVSEGVDKEETFAAQFGDIGPSGLARRDYEGFAVSQRALVVAALQARRLRLAATVRLRGGAWALATHAGISTREVGLLDAQRSDAHGLAAALNAFLEQRVDAMAGEAARLDLAPLHFGGRDGIEGGGMLYHRATHPTQIEAAGGTSHARRRFAANELPSALTQLCGHVAPMKALEVLAGYPMGDASRLGGLRLLTVGDSVSYEPHAPATALGEDERARLLYVDAGMNSMDPSDYPLLPLLGCET